MKKIFFVVAAAILIAVQVFVPASTAVAASNCGDSYTVVRGDTLYKIAVYCGTTVASILSQNAWIVNANLIYPGQEINLNGTVAYTGGSYYYTGGGTSYSGSARVTVSKTVAAEGSEITVTISGFPKNAEIDYRIAQVGEDYTSVYDSTTSSTGTDSLTFTLPSEATNGEYWHVTVQTTDRPKATAVTVTSHSIRIGTTSTGYTYTTSARVSLSKTRAAVGDTVKVYVYGFPAKSEIDYRVGRSGYDYSTVYDGTVGSDGSTSQTITIPSDANPGEYWVVKVMTTSQRTGVTVTSAKIYITN